MQKKLVNFFLTIVVLTYIIFEELIWVRFAHPIIHYISALKILKKLEIQLQRLHSVIILVIFLSMFVVVELLGVYAGLLFVAGHMVQGILVYAGKIPIAAFTFWLFGVSKEKLMQFGWFEKAYLFIMKTIDRLKASEVYINIKAKSLQIKHYVKEHFFRDKSLLKKKIAVLYKKLKVLLGL